MATRIDLNPTLTNTSVGSSFSVAVVISGLSGVSPALAVTDFDLDVSYDPALLSATGVTFGSGLGSPPDVSGSDLSSSGVVDLFAVSFASYPTLLGLQGDSFTLATLTFQSLAPGTDSLAFVQDAFFIVDLTNVDDPSVFPVNGVDPGTCETLSCVAVGGARVVIREATVPEPNPLLLLAGAVLALAAARRARKPSIAKR
jgi:hypothetical protein